jgi:hypothetical protein
MHRMILLLTGFLALPAAGALAAAPVQGSASQNADWPCQQRLVPRLAAGAFWNGAISAPDADRQKDPRVVQLIADIADREMPVDQGTARIAAFVDTLEPGERQILLPQAFLGIVEATNRRRGKVIQRIEELTRRQRELSAVVAKVTVELQAIPADAPGEEAARRAEIVQRRDFIIRGFEATQRTMRYACEVPVQLEARLGSYARALQAGL